MWNTINNFLRAVDDFVWGVPLMVLILFGGILLAHFVPSLAQQSEPAT